LVKPSVKYSNKKTRISHVITNMSLLLLPLLSPIKNINVTFCCLFSLTHSLLLHAEVCLLLFSSFIFLIFLINILYEFVFFLFSTSLAIILRLDFFFFFFSVFFFALYLFFVLDNCMNVVLGFYIYIWDQFSWILVRFFF
jgi:hypothetical protein